MLASEWQETFAEFQGGVRSRRLRSQLLATS